jgi:hypothetical protein
LWVSQGAPTPALWALGVGAFAACLAAPAGNTETARSDGEEFSVGAIIPPDVQGGQHAVQREAVLQRVSFDILGESRTVCLMVGRSATTGAAADEDGLVRHLDGFARPIIGRGVRIGQVVAVLGELEASHFAYPRVGAEPERR